MLTTTTERQFQPINRAYNSTFRPNHLSVGLVVPIEAYPGAPIPSMEDHLERVQLAEQLGFAAVWLRDVPFNVPNFGDAGQTFDPFVYLGFLAAQTQRIALGVASIILPLRHPAHVAKAAATADVLSGGRLLLGIASGDRAEEYPALNLPYDYRGAAFRQSFDYIRQMEKSYPAFANAFGSPNGNLDMLPKPVAGKVPLLITGSSQQDAEWIARHGDGWMTYPRHPGVQSQIIRDWRGQVESSGQADKPVMQPLYLDLSEDDDYAPEPIHLGFRLGVNHLKQYLKGLEEIGMNHVALNLRFNRLDIESTLHRLSDQVLSDFH